jgi:hypothetical protein
MPNSQFMVQVLKSLTNEYELRLFMIEKRIWSIENPLSIDELRKGLSLRYARLSLGAEVTNDIDLTEEKTLVTTEFK